MKRLFPLLLAVLLLFGCAAVPAETPATAETAGPQRYQATFLTLFDTVTTIVGYADSKADFTATAQELHDELLEYHQLYDIYNDYEGMTNLKTVNDRAGQGPVAVDRKILDLLRFSKELYARDGWPGEHCHGQRFKPVARRPGGGHREPRGRRPARRRRPERGRRPHRYWRHPDR